MKKYILFILLITVLKAYGYEYIFNDRCINELYSSAVSEFRQTEIIVEKDSMGIILRFFVQNPVEEYKILSKKTVNNLEKIHLFLAKIENSAIIEVHTADSVGKSGLKSWEISAVIAGRAEAEMRKLFGGAGYDRVSSVGYGEFFPAKNTPNKGVNYSNRIDIIVQCNISGE